MASQTIFYSWQADSDKSCNRYFIEECLKRAIRQLNREDLSDLVIDRNTKNVPGMPDIGHTIFEKIAKSAVVVADLTLINPIAVRRPDERPVCNPNVLFEFGYAFGTLGPQAMLGVFNTASGMVEELPFDLRPKRLMTYQLAAGDDKVEVRAKLVRDLSTAIRQCLGDTEEEQIRRNSRIHEVLSELWLFGTEIEEWCGIGNLSQVIQDNLTAAREALHLMGQRRSNNVALLNMTHGLIRKLESTATLTLNEENWPRIKELISSVADDADLIHRLLGYKIDQGYHDELVRRIASMPAELDGHLESLRHGQSRRPELEILAHGLRMMAFKSLIPQHPQFAAELKELSLHLRRHVLQWAKNTPAEDEAIDAVHDIRERLSQLIVKYSLPLSPMPESRPLQLDGPA